MKSYNSKMAHNLIIVKKVYPILWTWIISTMPLSAGPVLRIEKIDRDRFPRIELSAIVSNPYPGYQSNLDNNTFRIFMNEGLGKREIPVESVDRLDHEAKRLYAVMVIDATKSVRSKSFARMTGDAKRIAGRMGPDDRVAIYRINGKPDLVLEFTAEAEPVKGAIDGIERKGKITRIYDALYSALATARSATQSAAAGKSEASFKTAVVLLTDGRDEGSFITDEDVAGLAKFGKESGVPVYTILYDRSANRRTFQRLARLTGGEILEKPSGKELEGLWTSMRTLKEVRFRVSFVSPTGWEKGPSLSDREYRMSLSWRSGRSADEDSFVYTVPAIRLLTGSIPEKAVYTILFIGFVLITAGSVFVLQLLIKSLHRKKIIRELRSDGSGAGESFEHPLTVNYRKAEGEPEEPSKAVQTVRDLTGLLNGTERPSKGAEGATALLDRTAPKGQGVRKEVDEASAAAAIALETLIEKERLRKDPASRRRMALDEEKAAFLKDIAYRLLQTALRDAEAYESATLHLADDRRETREYDLFLETTVIGSGRWSHIHLSDKTVSPVHARIRRIDGKYILYDMVSESGLYLNGKKVLRPKPLWNGDRIKMGRTEFIFHAVRGED